MISESQERMLAIVRPDRVGGRPRGLRALGPAVRGDRDGDRRRRHRDRRGRRTPDARARAHPRPALTSDAIVHERVAAPPPRSRARSRTGRPDARARPAAGARHGPGRRAPRRSSDRRTSSARRPVFEQYDSTVQANTVAGPGQGAAVLRIKGTSKALVAATDGNQAVGRRTRGSGAAMSVAEATRNVAITGARPLGVTNCLNYGDPTRPEAFWQLSEAVRGLGDACRALGLPVTGGNVSLYNESPGGSIAPTPQIGVVGLLDERRSRSSRPAFRGRRRRDRSSSARRRPGLAGSEYAATGRCRGGGRPAEPRPRTGGRGPGVRPRGGGTRPPRLRPGRLAAAASRWPSPNARCGATRPRPRRRRAAAGRELAGRRPVRREPVADPRLGARRATLPRSSLLARQHGLAVGGARRRSAASGSSSSSPGPARRAPRRSAGAGSPTRSTSPLADLAHAWEHGLPRALGWRPAGHCLMCGVFGVGRCRPARAPRRRPSPRSACSRSSTAARNRPGSRSATASSSCSTRTSG